MRRLLAASIITVAVLSSGMSVISASPGLESDLYSKLNHERASRGLPALAGDTELLEVARRHSARMAAQSKLYHNPDLKEEVSNWMLLGENVGRGPDVHSIHAAFMDSPGHREQILHPDYRQVGIGVVSSGEQLWVTQVFVLRGEPPAVSASAHAPKSTSTSKVARVRPSAAAKRPASEPPIFLPLPAEPGEGHRMAIAISDARARPLAIGVPAVTPLRPTSPVGASALLLLCVAMMHLGRSLSVDRRGLQGISR